MGDGQVGILHGADADLPGDGRAHGLVEVGPGLVDDRAGLLDGLVEQHHQPQRLARAGLEDLAVLAEHVADLHVHRHDVVGEPAGLARGVPHHVEVQRLRRPDDVEHPVRLEVVHAVADRREVGRRVAVAAVGLADDERHRLALAAGVAVEEDAERAVRHRRDARGLELVAERAEHGVVGRLPGEVEVGERDAEGGVDRVEVGLGEVDELLPQREGVGVAGLQRDDPACVRGC